MILNRKFSVVICLFGLIACSTSNEDIAKKNFETSLSKQLNDPSSYEFVSIEPLKTLSKWDSIDGEVLTIEKQILDEMEIQNALTTALDATQSLINLGYGSITDLNSTKNDINISKTKESKLKVKSKEFKEKLKDVTLKNEIVEYRTNIQFRSKNALGALVLNSAYVRIGKNMDVIDFTLNNPKNNK
jgi:hypothetical protein